MTRIWLTLAAFLAGTSTLLAHGVGAEAEVRQGKIILKVFFDDDTPGARARIRILDSTGAETASGTADDTGTWTTAVPPPGRYQVAVDAGAGHRTTITLMIPPESAMAVSEGPTRADFTRYPWAKVLVGVGGIGAFAVVFLLARRKGRESPASEPRRA